MNVLSPGQMRGDAAAGQALDSFLVEGLGGRTTDTNARDRASSPRAQSVPLARVRSLRRSRTAAAVCRLSLWTAASTPSTNASA